MLTQVDHAARDSAISAEAVDTTVQAIGDAKIDHDRVVFEVTEADQTLDPGTLKNIISAHRDAGFGVALDDVGAGYSSLNLLHQLRPDYIKIDMELIRGVHMDSYKALIAEKILEIARSLNIETIAEGIETPEELAWVQQHGADYVQGYLISKPSEPRFGLTA
jgi:EAL domain-containing protein (putative c-di-GMP-specific phosphodiesterase class I)